MTPRARETRAAGNLLRWALAPRSTPPPLDCDPSDVARRAEHHGLAPLLYLALEPAGTAAAAHRAALAPSYHWAVRRHLQAIDDVAVVAPVLDRAAEAWVVLKGPVLAGFVYERADARSYVDLDVLVPASRLEQVVIALEGAGCTVLHEDWRELLTHLRGEIVLGLPSGALLDLHWHLVPAVTTRRRFTIAIEGLLAGRRFVPVGDQSVPALAQGPASTHLALHAALSGADRLVWVKDLDQQCRRDLDDWSELVEVAHRWSAEAAVATQLRRCRSLSLLDVPTGAWRALGPARSWATLAAAVDAVSPPERAEGGPSLSRVVHRAASSSGSASLAELGRRVMAWGRGHVGGASRVRRDAGAPSDRRAYFEAVAAADAYGLPG